MADSQPIVATTASPKKTSTTSSSSAVARRSSATDSLPTKFKSWAGWIWALIKRDKRARIMSYIASSVVLVLGALFIRRRMLLPPLPSKKKYDYIVVGGGSAGCVIAARLSEDPDVSVLLLEAGFPDTHNSAIAIPIAAGKLQRTDVDWQLRTEPQPKTNSRVHFWPRGKVLGGCSCLNYMLYVRGSSADYDSWEHQFGCKGWSYRDVLPYFIKSENRLMLDQKSSVDKQYHGVGGPLDVTDPAFLHKATTVFVEAAQSIGIPYNADYNGASQLGVGYSQLTISSTKRRADTAYSFLSKIRGRPNLTICTSAHVTRVLFDGKNKAIGVEYTSGRDDNMNYRTVRCSREVILSAGAIGSPHLLLLSGVGPREELRAHNIPLFRHIPAVGKKMQDHLLVGLAYRCTKPITMNKIVIEGNYWRNLANYIFFKAGPFTSQGLEAMAFVRSSICTLPYPIPDLQLHFVVGAGGEDARDNFGLPKEGTAFDHEIDYGFTMLPTLLHPRSRGSVTLRTSHWRDAPIINPNYLDDEHDLLVLMESIKISRQIFHSAAFDDCRGEEVTDPILSKQYPIESDDYIRELVRKMAITVYHPVGTCAMGPPEDLGTVVDTRLRVHGIEGLRVADASIMPDMPSANTNAPAIMIGEKVSDMIREDRLGLNPTATQTTQTTASTPARL